MTEFQEALLIQSLKLSLLAENTYNCYFGSDIFYFQLIRKAELTATFLRPLSNAARKKGSTMNRILVAT